MLFMRGLSYLFGCFLGGKMRVEVDQSHRNIDFIWHNVVQSTEKL